MQSKYMITINFTDKKVFFSLLEKENLNHAECYQLVVTYNTFNSNMDYNIRKGLENQIEEYCKKLVQDANNEGLGIMTGSLIEISFGEFRKELLDSLVGYASQLGVTTNEISELIDTTIDRMRNKYLC